MKTVKKKVKCSRYRPGVAQRVGRGIALHFLDHGTRRRWVVSSTPRPLFTPGKDAVPVVQETGWAPGPVWTGGKSLLHRDSIPDRPARSSVSIPTELPDPLMQTVITKIRNRNCACFISSQTCTVPWRHAAVFFFCSWTYRNSIGWFHNLG